MPDAVTHPTTQELAAFGLGKLPNPRRPCRRRSPGVLPRLP